MSEDKQMRVLSSEELDKLISKVPLRIMCILKELDYIFKEYKTPADKIEFFQQISNSLRLYDYGPNIQAMCMELYKQGILFDHSQAALTDGDDNPFANKRRTKEEIMEEPVKHKKKRTFEDMFLAPVFDRKYSQKE